MGLWRISSGLRKVMLRLRFEAVGLYDRDGTLAASSKYLVRWALGLRGLLSEYANE